MFAPKDGFVMCRDDTEPLRVEVAIYVLLGGQPFEENFTEEKKYTIETELVPEEVDIRGRGSVTIQFLAGPIRDGKAVGWIFNSATVSTARPGAFAQKEQAVCWRKDGAFNAGSLLGAASTATWTISGEPLATISGSGTVRFGTGPGTYTVTASGETPCPFTASLTLNVIEADVEPTILAFRIIAPPGIATPDQILFPYNGNLELDVKLTNRTSSHTPAFRVAILVRQRVDNPMWNHNLHLLDAAADIELGGVLVANGLLPSQATTITVKSSVPLPVSQVYGTISVRVLVDAEREITSSERKNNFHDKLGVVNDAVFAWRTVATFPSKSDAATFLTGLEFVPALNYPLDSGWTRPVLGIRSVFDRKVHDFRIHGNDGDMNVTPPWVVQIQGGDAGYPNNESILTGEPAPVLSLIWDLKWLNYVAAYHKKLY
jgi:hypothetical protein